MLSVIMQNDAMLSIVGPDKLFKNACFILGLQDIHSPMREDDDDNVTK
jgi:hypothetical protein